MCARRAKSSLHEPSSLTTFLSMPEPLRLETTDDERVGPTGDHGPQSSSRPRAWVLLSGGMDSATCLAFYLHAGFHVQCLHVDFGQLASRPESVASKRIAQHFDVLLTVLRWTPSTTHLRGEIVGRNAFLLAGASMEIGHRHGVLALGIHAGTRYYDCSPAFVTAMQVILDGYSGGRLRLGTPFLKWSKKEVVAYGRSEGVPFHLTYSCERNEKTPCGKCQSCRDRSDLDAS